MEEEVGFSITGETDPATAAVNRLTASMDKLDATMQKVQGKVGATEEPTNRMTGSVLKANIAFAALEKAASFTFDAIRSGLGEVAETEQVMLQASVAANRFGLDLAELQKAAEGIVTPLIEGEQKLKIVADLASRGFDPSQATQMANAMTDLVAAGKDAGTSLQDGMTKAVDALVKGRIAGDEMVRMFPSLKAVSAETLKAISTGTADAAQKQEVLNAVLRDSGAAAGAAEKYFQSFAGVMEFLKVTFADVTEALATGFLGALRPLIDQVMDAAGSMGDWMEVLQEIGTVIGQVLVAAFNAAKQVLSALVTNGITPLSLAFKAVGADTMSFKDIIMIVVQTVGGTLVSAFKLAAAGAMIFGNASKILENVWLNVKSVVLDSIDGVLQGIKEFIGATSDFDPSGNLAEAYSQLSSAQTAVHTSLRETNKSLADSDKAMTDLKGGVIELVDGAFKPLDLSIEKTSMTLTGKASPAIRQLTEDQKKLLAAFNEALSPMDALSAQYAELASIGVTYDDFVKVNYQNILDAADAQVRHGQTLNEAQQAMVNAAIAAEEEANAFEGSAAAIQLNVDAAQAAVEANNNLARAQDQINQILRTSANDMGSLQEAIAFYGDGINAINPDLQEYYDKLLAAESALTDQAAANGRAAAAAREAAEAFRDEMQAVEGLGNCLGFLSGVAAQFSGVMGDLIGSVQGGVKVFQDMREKGFSQTESAIGGLGAALQDLGSQFGGVAGEALQAAGAIAQAWAQGGPVAAAITGATILFSKLLSLFGHDWGKDAAKQVSLLTDGLEVSEELMKKITEDAKKMGNAMASSLIHLPDIFAELGVTMDNFDNLAGSLMDVFSGVEQGIIDVAQANEILKQTFPQLLDAALEFGGEYMDQLNQIVATAAQTGIGIDSMKEAIQNAADEIKQKLGQIAGDLNASLTPMIAQLKSDVIDLFSNAMPNAMIPASAALKTLSEEQIKSFNELIAQGKTAAQAISELGLTVSQVSELSKLWGDQILLNKENMDDLQTTAYGLAETVLTSFNAMIASGMSLSDALQAIGPNMDELREVFKALGISFADVGLGWLNQMEKINSKFPEQMAAINGVQQALQALNAAGITPSMTQFQALQNTALSAFDKITKGHEPTRAELASMAPTLSILAQNAAKYGYALDPDIQKLIELAKQQNIAIETDPSPTLEESMQSLVETLDKLNQMLATLTGSAGAYAGALSEIPSEINTTVVLTYDERGNQTGGELGHQDPRYATLRAPKTFKETQRIVVDPGETLLPRPEYMRGQTVSTNADANAPVWSGAAAMAGGGGAATIEATIPITVMMDGKQIYKGMTTASKRGRYKVQQNQVLGDIR